MKRYISSSKATDVRFESMGYEHYKTYDSNEKAKEEAASLRRVGYQARVVPTSQRGIYSYSVYVKWEHKED